MAALEALDHEPTNHCCRRRGGSRPGRRGRPLAHQIRQPARRCSVAKPIADRVAERGVSERIAGGGDRARGVAVQWLGEVVDAPGLPSGRDRAILDVGSSTVEMARDPIPLLVFGRPERGWERAAARHPRIEDGCEPGDVGLYTWSLSPGGTLLQLTATSDDCASRRAAFEGEWERSACRNPDNNCLGDLEAGTYKSQFIGPRLDDGEPWTANFGAFSYTVPDGWSNTADFPDDYVLMRSADYAVATDPKDGTKDLIEIVARPGSRFRTSSASRWSSRTRAGPSPTWSRT